MSIALLKSPALQSIILQALVNLLHDSSETICEVNGDHCSPKAPHALTLTAAMLLVVGDRFKMAPGWELTLLRVSIKFAKKNP